MIVADPPSFSSVADKCSNLDWLQSTFAGCDALIKTTTKRDFTCTRLAGVFGQKISEYARTIPHRPAPILRSHRSLTRCVSA